VAAQQLNLQQGDKSIGGCVSEGNASGNCPDAELIE